MAKNDTNLTDAEWEEKFNGPRDQLLKRIFGDTPCPVGDISPKLSVKDKNWEKKEDFMTSTRPRITAPLNADLRGLAEWNEQMQKTGKIVTAIRDDQLAELKAKPEPIK